MESHLTHSQQHTTLDRDEHDHEHGVEKQSVMKKVKAKAKKIKDSITKRGHHHQSQESHENRTELQHEEEEEEDDDDDEYEEVEKEPEVHGAPIYESQLSRNNPNVGLEGNQGMMHHEPNMERTDEQGKDNTRLGVPTSLGLMHHQPDVERIDETMKDNTKLGVLTTEPNSGRTDEPVVGKDHDTLGVPSGHGLIHHRPNVEKTDASALGNDHTRLGAEGVRPEPNLEEDVGTPRHSLREVPSPGTFEAKVGDQTGAGAQEAPGIAPLIHSLDKMSLDKPASGSSDHVDYQDKMSDGNVTVETRERDQLESGQPKKYRDMPDDSPFITGEELEQDTSLQGGDYAIAPKDAAAAAKLGYGDEKMDKEYDQTSQTSYMEKASHVASLLADKAVGVKDAVASKLGYGGTEEHKTPREPVDHEALVQQSGYVGKVSGVTSTLADKAVEAKNALASKLGYDQTPTGDYTSSEKPTSEDRSTIADKTAQEKNAVAPKLGCGPGEEGGHPMETSTWGEKLKPGVEDKALSELISGSVFKSTPHPEDTSDQQGEVKPMGNVTESEDVARRLGTSEAERKGDLTQIPGSESPKEAVLDKIKVAVSTLWNSGDETLAHLEKSTQSGSEHETDQSNAGVKSLQESAN